MMYMFAHWSDFYWFLFPNIMLRSFVDLVEITLIITSLIRERLNPVYPKIPETPESLVYLLCCYNESYAEMMNSLDSLAEQQSLEAHKKTIIVVCDGRVSCKGMTKTTSAHLKEDIVERPTSTFMRQAYTAWDDAPMDIEIIKGEFRGLPIICVIKNENRGKRDGIILIRTFLNKFNQRAAKPSLKMISPKLFAELSGFLQDASIQKVDYAVGIDADTRFDPKCVVNLIQTVREGDEIVGVTGYIRPDPKALGAWSISYLYQNAEYMVGQHRRRLRQSLTSGKVTCLPGCCQLLRVIEETCGDHILGKFGYYPKDSDGLFRTVRSMMSEDRDHVCLVLSEYAHVRTRVNLAAKAYTTAPTTPMVFMSQRRRWTLGPLTSDSLLLSRKSTGWMERAAALSSLSHWVMNPALLASRFFRTYHSCRNT
jgi:chitin synthase